MTSLGEPEIHTCTKMLRKLGEKFGAKLPVTTHGYSMVKFAHLADAKMSKSELMWPISRLKISKIY